MRIQVGWHAKLKCKILLGGALRLATGRRCGTVRYRAGEPKPPSSPRPTFAAESASRAKTTGQVGSPRAARTRAAPSLVRALREPRGVILLPTGTRLSQRLLAVAALNNKHTDGETPPLAMNWADLPTYLNRGSSNTLTFQTGRMRLLSSRLMWARRWALAANRG
jgi:hypothetical protein